MDGTMTFRNTLAWRLSDDEEPMFELTGNTGEERLMLERVDRLFAMPEMQAIRRALYQYLYDHCPDTLPQDVRDWVDEWANETDDVPVRITAWELVEPFFCGCGDMMPPPDQPYECENCKTAAWAVSQHD